MTIDDGMKPVTVDYLDRRLAEEFGRLRAEMAAGFGGLRAEMADRDAKLLKWLLVFLVGQTAALTGIIALFR